jgi:regulatory protein
MIPQKNKKVKKGSAYDAALRLLAVRSRSIVEIRKRLDAKGFSQYDVESVINRLSATKLLDDEAFARYMCESILRKKPAGSRLLISRLVQRGVSRRTAEETVQAVLPFEKELAYARSAAKQCRARFPDTLSEDTVRMRIARYLASRGFSAEIVRDIIFC